MMNFVYSLFAYEKTLQNLIQFAEDIKKYDESLIT